MSRSGIASIVIAFIMLHTIPYMYSSVVIAGSSPYATVGLGYSIEASIIDYYVLNASSKIEYRGLDKNYSYESIVYYRDISRLSNTYDNGYETLRIERLSSIKPVLRYNIVYERDTLFIDKNYSHMLAKIGIDINSSGFINISISLKINTTLNDEVVQANLTALVITTEYSNVDYSVDYYSVDNVSGTLYYRLSYRIKDIIVSDLENFTNLLEEYIGVSLPLPIVSKKTVLVLIDKYSSSIRYRLVGSLYRVYFRESLTGDAATYILYNTHIVSTPLKTNISLLTYPLLSIRSMSECSSINYLEASMYTTRLDNRLKTKINVYLNRSIRVHDNLQHALLESIKELVREYNVSYISMYINIDPPFELCVKGNGCYRQLHLGLDNYTIARDISICSRGYSGFPLLYFVAIAIPIVIVTIVLVYRVRRTRVS